MAPIALEKEDHTRDADFNKALHGKSAQNVGGIKSMMGKDTAAQKAAVEEYFKHFDNKKAETETEEERKSRRDEYATLTRQYDTSVPAAGLSLTSIE
jgi:sterol 24-C-methyltransferase